MILRRYIGRATGTRRIKKRRKVPKLSPLSWLIIATGAMVVACAVVLIINPGANIPDEEKGSQQSSGVTPEPTSTPPTEHHGTG
jgi:hypothetical protein